MSNKLVFNISNYEFGQYNETRDVGFFFSRPDLHPPVFTIHSRDVDLADSSLFFVSPKAVRFQQNGPYIFDCQGELVWSGAQSTVTSSVGLHVCNYRDVPHLCYWDGDSSMTSLGRGSGKILDSSYQLVAEVTASSSGERIDFHDFHIAQGGRNALVTVYRSIAFDLGLHKDILKYQTGWIWNCGFQEIEIETGRVVFEWWALDHVNPQESITPISIFDGQTWGMPWDYFHINSVAKAENGDYIVSGRHTGCVYRISGINGSIIWRLGGNRTNIVPDFDFGYQHDVRIQHESGSDMVLTMFNNGWDGRHERMTDVSSGLVIRVDSTEQTATLVRSYTANLTTTSQGNMVLMPSSANVLLGHGDATWLTEFTSDGSITLVASIGGNMGSNYLAARGHWIGSPRDPPRVFAYAKTALHPLAVYASWNGATQVYGWRFYGVDDEQGGTPRTLGTVLRNGFETSFLADRCYSWAFAEALGASGESLGNSTRQKAWFPGPELAKSCSNTSCPIVAQARGARDEHGARGFRQTGTFDKPDPTITSLSRGTLPMLQNLLVSMGLISILIFILRRMRPKVGWLGKRIS